MQRQFRSELLLVAATVVLGVAFAASMLHLSELRGRLAIPLAYDDIVYFIEGFDLFEKSIKFGIASIIQPLLVAHAPFQSLLSVFGYYIFGVNDWSGYQMNAVLLIAFLLALLWLTRSLDALVRLAIIVLVLATPFTANLVTEFRPDLFWGVLCGFAIFLIVQPNLLDSGWEYKLATVLVSVAALHAKPSASPATALILAAALGAAVILRQIYQPLNRQDLVRRIGIPLIGGVLLLAPFFVTNAVTIYNYIYIAFVTLGDVNAYRASAWDHAVIYSVGLTYRNALYVTLWIGFAAFAANIFQLIWNDRRRELIYYLCYASVILLAYLIPTFSSVKSYFLGGVFYGSFLVFTVASLTMVLAAIPTVTPRSIVAVSIAAVAVLFAPGNPLVTSVNPRLSADLRAVYERMLSGIVSDVQTSATQESKGVPTPIVVYTSSPAVMNAGAIQLMMRWRNVRVHSTAGYYTRTLGELESELEKADYAIISEYNDKTYPGSLLSPQLLQVALDRPDFDAIAVYTHPSGKRTYLFKRKAGDTDD